MLKESEWNTINSILVDFYTVDDAKVLASKTLSVLRLLIPFSKGYFIFLDKQKRISKDLSVFLGFDEKAVAKYVETYYDKDYLQYLYSLTSESIVYKDSSMLSDDLRTSTEFYQLFLEPAKIPFGAGIVIAKNKDVAAVFNMFRGENLGDFSDKDMYILNILRKHLENMVFNTIQTKNGGNQSENYLLRMAGDCALSERETDVLRLIAEGRSNTYISEQIHVSLSTVKKHVYNIFNKAGVNSRAQLLTTIFTR